MHDLQADAHDREDDADAEPHTLSYGAVSAHEIAQPNCEEDQRERQEEDADQAGVTVSRVVPRNTIARPRAASSDRYL